MYQNKKKMLYLMHVSWGWIKQRPHFIAENLQEFYDLKVYYCESFIPKKQLVKTDYPLFTQPLYSLPLQRFLKYRLYNKISNYFNVLQLKQQLKKVNYIWITSPNYFSMFKNRISDSHIVIYDCMDDFLEFPSIKHDKSLFLKTFSEEKDLLSRANFIFSSSEYLKEKLNNRYIVLTEIFIVNNAISSSFFNKKDIQNFSNYDRKKGITDLLYVGTISHWFNFDLIIESLDKFENIRYILIGPTEVIIPNHDRIIYLGPKNHGELQSYMNKTDALIMPFIVNDLIKSVNPVKLYEYIYSGKPIITCSYTEINQFNQFVYQYETGNQFFNLMQKLINKELMVRSEVDRLSFLHKNTWQKRSDEILKILDGI
jgi:glycosyltransferase involved in cell wall biosynthesis